MEWSIASKKSGGYKDFLSNEAAFLNQKESDKKAKAKANKGKGNNNEVF